MKLRLLPLIPLALLAVVCSPALAAHAAPSPTSPQLSAVIPPGGGPHCADNGTASRVHLAVRPKELLSSSGISATSSTWTLTNVDGAPNAWIAHFKGPASVPDSTITVSTSPGSVTVSIPGPGCVEPPPTTSTTQPPTTTTTLPPTTTTTAPSETTTTTSTTVPSTSTTTPAATSTSTPKPSIGTALTVTRSSEPSVLADAPVTKRASMPRTGTDGSTLLGLSFLSAVLVACGLPLARRWKTDRGLDR